MVRSLFLAHWFLACWFWVCVSPAVALAQPAEIPQAVPNVPQFVIDTGGFRSRINANGVVLSPDGRLVAGCADQDVRVWDIRSGRLLATMRGERSHGSYGYTWAAAFSPDGTTLVVGMEDQSREGSIRLYETRQFKQTGLLSGHRLATRKLVFSSDGRWLATATEDGGIHVWDWPTRKLMKSIPGISRVSSYKVFQFVGANEPSLLVMNDKLQVLSLPGLQVLQNPTNAMWMRMLGQLSRPDIPFKFPGPGLNSRYQSLFDIEHRKFFLSSFNDQTRRECWAAVWNLDEQAPSAVYRGHAHPIFAISVSQDGRIAATGDEVGNVHVWETQRGGLIRAFAGNHRRVSKLAWVGSADANAGSRLLGMTYEGNPTETQVLDLRNRTFRPLAAGQQLLAGEFARRGDYTVKIDNSNSGGVIQSLSQGRGLGEWRFESGRKVGKLTFGTRDFLGGEPAILFADEEGSLAAWDGRRKDQILQRLFVGHDGMVNALAVSPDNKLLASASVDGTIRIWSLENLAPEAELDVRFESNRIVEIFPGSEAEKVGLKVGDVVQSVGGFSLSYVEELKLQKKYPHKPGDSVVVEINRPGQGLIQKRVELVAGADLVKPLLSYFATTDDEWIVWTPQGYYDSSPGAARMIGWLQNQGKARDAKFIPAVELQKNFYRPELIDQALATNGLATNLPNLQDPAVLKQHAPADIVVKSPVVNAKVDDPDDFVVSATLTSPSGSDIERVEIYLDSVLKHQESFSRNPVELNQLIATKPGRHTVRLMVHTANGAVTSSSEIPFQVDGKVEAAAAPRMHLLAIGISEFQINQMRQSNFKNLKYCASDAAAFLTAVKSRAPTVKSEILLQNVKACRGDMIELFEKIKESPNIQENDYFVMFMASHGIINGARGDYYLIPHDVNPDRISSSALKWTEIIDLLKSVPAKNKILFLDTCHAAAIQKDPLHEFSQLPIVIFSSSEAKAQSLEIEKEGHGAFTAALLKAMNDVRSDTRDKKGVLDIQELREAVKVQMKQITDKHAPVFMLPKIPLDMERLELFKVAG